MAALSIARRALGLDRAKWERVGPWSLRSAAAYVAVASILLAMNRFGGLVTVEPRSFVRLVLVGVWGWIGMALVAWIVVTTTSPAEHPHRSPAASIAIVGIAHIPLIWLAGVLFLAAGALQLLWPGLMTAAFVFTVWFPAAVFMGLRVSCGAGFVRAMVATAVSYAAWLAVIGRQLYDQLAHLV